MSRPIQTIIVAAGSFYVGRTVDHPALDKAEEKIEDIITEVKNQINFIEEKKEEPKGYVETAWNTIKSISEKISPEDKND